jgi:hypothetical protein
MSVNGIHVPRMLWNISKLLITSMETTKTSIKIIKPRKIAAVFKGVV